MVNFNVNLEGKTVLVTGAEYQKCPKNANESRSKTQ